ncbi:MAG TPA: hypothetical protein VK142_09005 [Bacillota bacterium]|nr:hypothetical protein [Bacillota bacterium]
MRKYYIGLPILLFTFLTVKQLIFNDTVHWMDNAGISILAFLFYNLWEWSKKPFEWRKKKDPQ